MEKTTWARPWIAAAAGFLLAVLLFRPWERVGNLPPTDEIQRPPFAQLAFATGPIEVSMQDSSDWQTLRETTTIPLGCRMRTGPSRRCELTTHQGATIRLDTETELSVERSSEVNLSKGRVWCSVVDEKSSLAVKTPRAIVTVNQGTCDVADNSQSTEVLVVEGSVTVGGANWQKKVEPGRAVSVVDGRLVNETSVGNPIIATRWIHDILLRKGDHDQELENRIHQLWAEVGRAKMTHLYENEIRNLGNRCVKPLSAYLLLPQTSDNQNKRVRAARILADLAGPRSIPRLIPLLSDTNPQVRSQAATGLERLTGQNFGADPEDWQTMSVQACAPLKVKWQKWLESQKDRFPSATSNAGEKRAKLPA